MSVPPDVGAEIVRLYRFAQHCHKVDIDADSWRDKNKFERDDTPPPSRPTRRRSPSKRP